jgi:uncharacterized protein (TIGR03790 family)
MMSSRAVKIVFTGAALAWFSAAASGDLVPTEVVIVANADMRESRQLAVYYAEKRGIPRANICLLPLPTNEVISRKLYENLLRDPLAEFLERRRLARFQKRDPKSVKPHETPWTGTTAAVRAVVLVYGVPVRIEDTRWLPLRKLTDRRHMVSEKDTAAVESELALLLAGPYPIGGYVPNPLFRRLEMGDDSRPRLLIVTRLDGPGPDVVRRLVDATVAAETRGLQGRCYFDAMGSRGGAYYIGDYWIREACARFEREGFECVLDNEPRLFGAGYPMEDVAVYLGWYNATAVGPMARPDFHFMPGALAAHIHSTSAMRLRTDKEYWVGPLLARGACASWGAVSEPYLNGMPHLDVLADRLCLGWTFGESMYAALPVLSWQVAIVGDPLYRPLRLTVEEQIAQMERDGDPGTPWAYIRKVNLLAREGKLKAALDYARSKSADGKPLALVEKLGDLLAVNEMWEEAVGCYELVFRAAETPETAVRVAAKAFPILERTKRSESIREWKKIVREKWPASAALGSLESAAPL